MIEAMQDDRTAYGNSGKPFPDSGSPRSSEKNLAKIAAAFHEHRPRLFAIAYRMLGSASEVEDILQEAFLRWQQSSRDQIESPEAFLVTIVTRLCLNHLSSARLRREQYFGLWLPEPMLTEPPPTPSRMAEIDESLSIAFLALLERLNPMERAVFLLREVFDYEYTEISQILDQSEANCRQIFRRARHHLKQSRTRFNTSRQEREEMLQKFLQASRTGDMEGLLTLFAKDIVFYADGGGKSAAVPNPIYGANNVARFVVAAQQKRLPRELISSITLVNGQPAIVSYLRGKPFSVLAIEVANRRIRNIFVVNNPDKLSRLKTVPSPC